MQSRAVCLLPPSHVPLSYRLASILQCPKKAIIFHLSPLVHSISLSATGKAEPQRMADLRSPRNLLVIFLSLPPTPCGFSIAGCQFLSHPGQPSFAFQTHGRWKTELGSYSSLQITNSAELQRSVLRLPLASAAQVAIPKHMMNRPTSQRIPRSSDPIRSSTGQCLGSIKHVCVPITTHLVSVFRRAPVDHPPR